MYPWHTAAPPTVDPPFDGQLHVDNLNRISQWDATLGAWHRQDDFYMKEIGRFWIEATGHVLSDDIGLMFATRMKAQWDSFYAKAFVEVRTAISGQVLYQAQLTYAELETLVLSNLDTSGGSFAENAEVIVREIIDPTVRCSRMQVWNSIYSSARGRNAYNRRYGRDQAGLPDSYTSHAAWRGGAGFWTDGFTDPGRDFMQAFHGITPGPVDPDESDKIIWFHASHYNLYHQPKVGSQVSPTTGRQVYNQPGDAYQFVPGGLGMTVGSPRIFMRTNDSTVRSLESPGDGAIVGSGLMYNRVGAVVVYPLTDGAGNYAFYVKPLGVDWVSFSINSDPSMSIVSNSKFGDAQEDLRHLVAGDWNAGDDLSLRLFLFDAIPPQASSNRHKGLDVADTLSDLSFFAWNPTTGLRSEPFSTHIKLVRRKANAQMALEPRRS